jgi:hypothetical protein
MPQVSLTELLRPPTFLTQLEALPGNPYGPGLHLLDRPRGPINCDAFGFGWLFIGTPVGVSQTARSVTRYGEPLAQVLEVKSDVTAATLNGEVYDIDQDEGRQYFSEFPITRISVTILPACSLNLYWILIL